MIQTPCIKYCRLKGNVCQGCFRSVDQLRNWSKYTDEEREKIMSECKTKMRGSPLND